MDEEDSSIAPSSLKTKMPKSQNFQRPRPSLSKTMILFGLRSMWAQRAYRLFEEKPTCRNTSTLARLPQYSNGVWARILCPRLSPECRKRLIQVVQLLLPLDIVAPAAPEELSQIA